MVDGVEKSAKNFNSLLMLMLQCMNIITNEGVAKKKKLYKIKSREKRDSLWLDAISNI
jgi:hypothetical protein